MHSLLVLNDNKICSVKKFAFGGPARETFFEIYNLASFHRPHARTLSGGQVESVGRKFARMGEVPEVRLNNTGAIAFMKRGDEKALALL